MVELKAAGSSWSYAWQPMVETCSLVRDLHSDRSKASMMYSVMLGQRGDMTDPKQKISVMQACAEAMWFRCGAPYYKVSSSCYWSLVRTSLDHCKLSDIRLPFTCVELRFSDECADGLPVVLLASGRFDAEAVKMSKRFYPRMNEVEHGFEGDVEADVLMMGAQQKAVLDDPQDGVSDPIMLQLGWRTDVDEGRMVGDLDWQGIERSSKNISSECFVALKRHHHVALGVLLLATHAHDELFSPVLLRRDESRYGFADVEVQQRMVARAIRLHRRKGWVVGGSLICPTIRDEKSDSGEPTGRHLDYRHWRAGHFHHVRHGKAHGLTKLLWFKPTVVRADLPENVGVRRSYKV